MIYQLQALKGKSDTVQFLSCKEPQQGHIFAGQCKQSSELSFPSYQQPANTTSVHLWEYTNSTGRAAGRTAVVRLPARNFNSLSVAKSKAFFQKSPSDHPILSRSRVGLKLKVVSLPSVLKRTIQEASSIHLSIIFCIRWHVKSSHFYLNNIFK